MMFAEQYRLQEGKCALCRQFTAPADVKSERTTGCLLCWSCAESVVELQDLRDSRVLHRHRRGVEVTDPYALAR